MSLKGIAIHGFGRIGRTTLRIALERKLFCPELISDIRDLKTLAALLEVDSNYGVLPYPIEIEDSDLRVFTQTQLMRIHYNDASKGEIIWEKAGVKLVIDSTGRATTREAAEEHLKLGAKKVLVSAPSKSLKDCDVVLLPGINLSAYDPEKHHIISMASCTTNALAPMVKVLHEKYGIENGFFSTVHAYTNTQSLTDQPMKDRRDSWAASENIIPSSSGAAKALKFIWPDLNITGKAYRVPVKTGSIVELTANLRKKVTDNELKNAFREAAAAPELNGILGVLEGEYASSRIVKDSHSSIVDLPLIQVLDDKLVSVAAWYDNEWGYASRLAEVAQFIAERG